MKKLLSLLLALLLLSSTALAEFTFDKNQPVYMMDFQAAWAENLADISSEITWSPYSDTMLICNQLANPIVTVKEDGSIETIMILISTGVSDQEITEGIGLTQALTCFTLASVLVPLGLQEDDPLMSIIDQYSAIVQNGMAMDEYTAIFDGEIYGVTTTGMIMIDPTAGTATFMTIFVLSEDAAAE